MPDFVAATVRNLERLVRENGDVPQTAMDQIMRQGLQQIERSLKAAKRKGKG